MASCDSLLLSEVFISKLCLSSLVCKRAKTIPAAQVAVKTKYIHIGSVWNKAWDTVRAKGLSVVTIIVQQLCSCSDPLSAGLVSLLVAPQLWGSLVQSNPMSLKDGIPRRENLIGLA